MSSQVAAVDIEGETIRVQDITIEDGEAADFLSGRDEDVVAELVTEALGVGLTALRLTQTSVDVEFVERKFGEMVSEFSTQVDAATDEFGDHVDDVTDELDDTIGENGRLDTEFDRYLGEDGKLADRLEAAFAEDGPFHERLDAELGENGDRIQDAVEPKFKELRDLINQQQGADSVIQQSTLKGDEFEDTVGNILEQISAQTSDRFEFTGETVGDIPDAKVGDFVYEIGGTTKRIVVEAKTEGYGLDEIKDEMERAIENRDADYGVFVTDHLGNVPRTKVGWFHEFDRDFVTVALSEDSEADIEPAFLRFAMNWAQVRALHDTDAAGDTIDTGRIQSEADAIDEKIARFAQIRGKCTSIEDSVDAIRDELDEIESEVDDRLADLRSELAGPA